ncbi:GBF-interacting protein 1-like isoform X1 [Morus notabilis]|uniref:GBF-interacting protein 1-like isoform X1 n=1 Tax=Morus notabilis TaxID=981085 RepID=UPI000CED135A|nr:GBF-interacting protein 1-like isoform X1 [Morus notabilis]
MVSASRIDGGPQILSAGVRKTIQSIKEIVGNHSDIDIYLALKETNMDPNETAQKLLNQDPFHEVRRKRDKKKESAGNDSSTDPRGHSEVKGQGSKVNTFSDRNARRGGYARNSLPGVSREFRVVRDNRVNRSLNREAKPASASPTPPSTFENISGKGSTGSSNSEKPTASKNSSQGLYGPSDSHLRIAHDIESTGLVRKEVSEEKRVTFSSVASRVQAGKANNARSQSAMVASSSSAIGVYSSSTDPVHVPSPDSRSSGSVGAIKREVGVVGVRRQSSDNSKSSVPSSSFSNSLLGGEGSAETLQSFSTISKNDEVGQASESILPSVSVSRSLLSSHYSNRQQHQQPVGHQKASQPNKEWKPKSSQKPSLNNPGVIGTPTKSVSPPAHNSEVSESEPAKVLEKLSRVNIHENQNVIIAQHIRVPETDRCRLTFGSFGKEFESDSDLVNGYQAGAIGESNGEAASSLSAPESSIGDASGSKQVDLTDEQIRNSGSDSPTSGGTSENQFPDKKESTSPQNLDNYADIGLVQGNSPSYAPADSQQPEHPELPGFSAYDSQTGYDFPYFRPASATDEAMRGQGLPTPQEAFSSHNTNSVPTTISMVQQQQQPPVAQMYPQVHVSHFANLMPYRQFLSPVYVPPMAMPGYSSSPAYPHPSNGNSYLLMPGGGTHLNANSLKYGVQQFKPVPAGNPTGFGNFSNPNGYAINTPGVVGGATGLEDSSRIKYKDGNLYVPNPQAETSEMWIQNPRELPGLQSTPYYNMPGQSPHAAYLPSHTGHASYNAAAAQSSHMQFPGLYHPPQPAAIANPHHLGPAMGGNVGVGVAAAAPGAQVGAYQQPQLGHLNWTTNF